ncbi:MAG: stage II sporulation protein M [Candidatus Aenigmatarchaeota archaeon]
MVLESLIGIKTLKEKPWIAFFYSAIISIISVYISYVVFTEYAGIFIAIFISVAITPIFKTLILSQMKKEIYRFRKSFFERHYETIKSFLIIFFGLVFGLTSIFYILPKDVSEKIFKQQIETINKIRGNFLVNDIFLKIFLNNFSVLTLSFILSFVYGGFLIVLVWNITVLASAIGMLKESFGIFALPMGFLTYLPHGIFEFIAYFIGGFSGLILSSYFMKEKFKSKYILNDAIRLYLFGVFLLLIGAIIEVYLLLF